MKAETVVVGFKFADGASYILQVPMQQPQLGRLRAIVEAYAKLKAAGSAGGVIDALLDVFR